MNQPAISRGMAVLQSLSEWVACHDIQVTECPDSLLRDLDEQGFLIAPGEDFQGYAVRLKKLQTGLSDFWNKMETDGKVELEKGFVLHDNDRIPDAFYAECGELTRQKYKFTLDWVPGFFPEQNIGLLWAGCTWVSDALPFPVFTVRREFRTREYYLKIYGRKELLAHEIVHAAHAPIEVSEWEEHFAYAVSDSAFRRRFGNCFRTEWDAILFSLPLVGLSGIQIVSTLLGLLIAPWVWRLLLIAALTYPLFLILRNFLSRRRYFKAQKYLITNGIKDPDSLLFRCSAEEIQILTEGKIAVETLFPQTTFRGRFLQNNFF